MSAERLVLVERDEGIATVTLNRPQVKNAMSRALIKELEKAGGELAGDSGVEVMIITGAGDDAFSAGLDLKEMPQAEGLDAGAFMEEMIRTVRDPINTLRRFDRPVIGAINGVAITGGLELALNCDILLASENARFADTHTKVGVPPGWGMSQLLPRAVGIRKAKEMSFTGRFVSAQEAHAWGLVNQVWPLPELVPAACRMAKEIQTRVPVMVKHFKKVIDGGMGKSLDDAWVYELDEFEAYLNRMLGR